MPAAIPAIALTRERDEFASTRVAPSATTWGSTAPRTTSAARDSTRIPNASGNSSNVSRRVASIHAKAARPIEVKTIAQRKLPLERSRMRASKGDTIANGAMVNPR
jgi:hypothetical protein